MSYITCYSDTDLSSDRSRLVNTYKAPLKISKDAKIGLTSLSFEKSKQYVVTAGENDTFYMRLCEEGDKQFGQKFRVTLTPGQYTGETLGDEILEKLDSFPMANWAWVELYDGRKEHFMIGCFQVSDTTTNLTLANLVDPQTGGTSFLNNGTAEVGFSTDGSWTGSTSFTDLVPDQMCVSTSQIYPDGTSTNGVDDPDSGGLFIMEAEPQTGSTGYGIQKLGLTGYWNINNGNTNAEPSIDGTKSLVDFQYKDNAGRTATLVSLKIMLPDRAINPPSAGWEGSQSTVFLDVDVTNLSSIGKTDWISYTYGFDALYASIEVTRQCEIIVSIWHDTGLDGSVKEKQVIAQTGDANFPFMLKQHHYPILGTCAKSSGDASNKSIVKLSGLFSDELKANPNTPLGSEISGELDTAELVSQGEQGSLSVTLFSVFGTIYNSDNLGPFDGTVSGNADALLGMERFISQKASDDHSVISTTKAKETLITPDIHIELEDFNIKGLRSTTQSIGRIIGVIPGEELNVNTDTGIIHFYTTSPIMIKMNLENDYNISNLTVALKDSEGKALKDLIGTTNLSLFVE